MLALAAAAAALVVTWGSTPQPGNKSAAIALDAALTCASRDMLYSWARFVYIWQPDIGLSGSSIDETLAPVSRLALTMLSRDGIGLAALGRSAATNAADALVTLLTANLDSMYDHGSSAESAAAVAALTKQPHVVRLVAVQLASIAQLQYQCAKGKSAVT